MKYGGSGMSPTPWGSYFYYADNAAKNIFAATNNYAMPAAVRTLETPYATMPAAKVIIAGPPAGAPEYSGPAVLRIFVGVVKFEGLPLPIENLGPFFNERFPPIVRVEYDIRNANQPWHRVVRQYQASTVAVPVVWPVRLYVFPHDDMILNDPTFGNPIVDVMWEVISTENGGISMSGIASTERQSRKYLSIAAGATEPNIGVGEAAQPQGGLINLIAGSTDTVREAFQGWDPTRAIIEKRNPNDNLTVNVFNTYSIATGWSIPTAMPPGVASVEVRVDPAVGGGMNITNNGAANSQEVVVTWIADRD